MNKERNSCLDFKYDFLNFIRLYLSFINSVQGWGWIFNCPEGILGKTFESFERGTWEGLGRSLVFPHSISQDLCTSVCVCVTVCVCVCVCVCHSRLDSSNTGPVKLIQVQPKTLRLNYKVKENGPENPLLSSFLKLVRWLEKIQSWAL